MTKSVDKLVALALGEVGVLESGGNNCGERIREYQGATNLKPGAWPWCAAFTSWLLREWLDDIEVREDLNILPGQENSWLCRSAGAFKWEEWAKAKGLKILTEKAQAKAGDFVVFDFSHIGIVVKDQAGLKIETVEGNTNGKGERDSLSGDGVWRKTRNRSLVKCYIRIIS